MRARERLLQGANHSPSLSPTPNLTLTLALALALTLTPTLTPPSPHLCCKASLLPSNAFGQDAPEGSEEFRFQLIAALKSSAALYP